MKQYMTVAPDGRVDALFDREDDETPPQVEGFTTVEVIPPFAGGWPVAPGPTKILHWLGGAFNWLEMLTLDALKERKRAEITAARLTADADHFTYQGVKVRTADKDIFDLLVTNARIQMGEGMPLNWVGGWLGIDGIVFIATREEWKPFFIAMYDAGMANFMYSQQLKAEIENAATTEQVLAISWL